MQALAFWKAVTMDHVNFLERLVSLLNEHHIQYCVIGGQAVNAYADPVVSLDLDLAVVVAQLPQVRTLLEMQFVVKEFPHSLNVYVEGSDLRVQIQTDPRYAMFPEQAVRRDILGLELPVAQLEDVLKGKIWAASDSERRGSKRQKDLADIARLIENYPELRAQVPQEILVKLL